MGDIFSEIMVSCFGTILLGYALIFVFGEHYTWKSQRPSKVTKNSRLTQSLAI